MISDNELLALLALQNVKNIGDTIAKKLITHTGAATQIFKEKKSDLLKIDGIGTHILSDLHNPKHHAAAQKELAFIKSENIDYHYFDSPSYPPMLKHCLDGPILLFSSGNINLQNKKIISIVGTRKVTTYGIAFCEALMQKLREVDPIIVSGFAYGVDITAHKFAIQNGLQTIACMAHGLNQTYPKSHKKYVHEVEKNGGFVTDFWSSSSPDRHNFLMRNRIIAGMSEATIVIESASKGGSLVTAEIANSYNREVFAVPGRTTDQYSQGCNTLIKNHKAHLLSEPSDVLEMLAWNSDTSQPVVQKQLFVELNTEEQQVYDYLKIQDKELLDTIAKNCQIPTFKLASILLNMELKGVVRPLPGKQFEIV